MTVILLTNKLCSLFFEMRWCNMYFLKSSMLLLLRLDSSFLCCCFSLDKKPFLISRAKACIKGKWFGKRKIPESSNAYKANKYNGHDCLILFRARQFGLPHWCNLNIKKSAKSAWNHPQQYNSAIRVEKMSIFGKKCTFFRFYNSV